MLAISTSCVSKAGDWTVDELNRLLDHDVHGFELGPQVPQRSMEAVLNAIRTSRRVVTNLYGPCPTPRALGKRSMAAWPHIADLDRDRRRTAVEAIIETLELASKIECPVVVIDCGETSAPDPTAAFDAMVVDGSWHRGEGERSRRDFILERARSESAHLDALCFSIDRIVNRAEQFEVSVALNQGRHAGALPSTEELLRIMDDFSGAPLGTWYATARSHGLQHFGFEDPMIMRRELIPKARGCHLEDVIDVAATDEQPGQYQRGLLPGTGFLDFHTLLDGVREDASLVLQPEPWHQPEDIGASLEYLRNLGLEGPPPEACEPFPIIGG